MKQITVYHRAARDGGDPAYSAFTSYQHGDPVAPVFTYVATMPAVPTEDDRLREAEHAFHMFNAPPEFLGGQDAVTAAQYRANHLRSLSVGDLVAVGSRVYACQPAGFKRVTASPFTLNVQPDKYLDETWAEEAEAARTGEPSRAVRVASLRYAAAALRAESAALPADDRGPADPFSQAASALDALAAKR